MEHNMPRKKLIQSIYKNVSERLSNSQLKPFQHFLNTFLLKSPIEDMSDIMIDDWSEICIDQFNLLCEINERSHMFSIKDGTCANGTFVNFSLVVKDTPFLVDSCKMLMSRNHYQIIGVVNAASVYVERNPDTKELVNVSYQDKQISTPYAILFFQMLKTHSSTPIATLKTKVTSLLREINYAVSDWDHMKKHLSMITELYQQSSDEKYANIQEVVDFVIWLKEYFTFIGFREYRKVNGRLELIDDSELGVLKLRESNFYKPISRSIPEDQLISISKTNSLSTIHRDVQTDLIIFKTLDLEGHCIGEKRFVGLFTSDAYDSDPLRIPLLRQKIKEVVISSNLNSSRFARKKLLFILRSLPREELFQASVEELYQLAIGIYELQDRHLFRVFIRYGLNNNFVYCHVYIPRSNYNTNVFHRIKALLCQKFMGRYVSGIPTFKDSNLMNIHFVIGRDDTDLCIVDQNELSEDIQILAESWEDLYQKALIKKHGYKDGSRIFQELFSCFEASYRAYYSPKVAVLDSELIYQLNDNNPIHFLIYRSQIISESGFHVKILQYNQNKLTLSRILPMLENMNFNVINERSYKLMINDRVDVLINDIVVDPLFSGEIDFNLLKTNIIPCLKALYNEEVENDILNSLVSTANLTYLDAQIIRVYCKFLHQLNFGLSDVYVQQCLLRHPDVVSQIIELFNAMFNPQMDVSTAEISDMIRLVLNEIDQVENIDEDRVLRQFLGMVSATVRTNYFTASPSGICIKLKSRLIPNISLPRPEFEAFVYASDFEGIHLRSGKVARGGLRWSNRIDDFRTEVLDLMVAQKVKNAIIVPAGAKGGFVVKKSSSDYDQNQKYGIDAYHRFITSLLSICDNVKNGKIIKPKHVKCYDDNDPYFVVAADKGTATFSDHANSISKEYQFWLDDAFASGGRHGYDHKELGITAKGAWESVVWHFKTLNIDMEKPFTVIGIGDMSGDVFGNGMLLSDQIKLVAAFNHEAIFLDPNPNTQKSRLERQRLFDMPRSRWFDYNPKLISKGGGVFSRSLKTIKLSPEIQKVLDIKEDALTPSKLIQGILKAPVDLLWNGGIGTYVKASDQTHAQVADKFNDGLRVNACDLRVKIITEGGNLGLTQSARVEFASLGGLVNADFIDNSGGVDCSDVEVNTKILLNDAILKQKITFEDRNAILIKIKNDVIHSILSRNSMANDALSLAQYQLPKNMVLYTNYLHWLESNHIVDRKLSGISNDSQLLNRNFFTRPELAILFSNTILWIKDKLSKSQITQAAIVEDFLYGAFPAVLKKKFKTEIDTHYLRDQIIATQIANYFVREVGVTFVHQLSHESHRSFEEIIRAYLIARKLIDYEKQIGYLDDIRSQIKGEHIVTTLDYLRRLLRRLVRFLLFKNYKLTLDHEELNSLIKKVRSVFDYSCRYESSHAIYESKCKEFVVNGVNVDSAKKIAGVAYYWHVLNIIEGIERTGAPQPKFVKHFYFIREQLKMNEIIDQLDNCLLSGPIDHVSKISLKFDIENNFLDVVISSYQSNKHFDEWYDSVCSSNWKDISARVLSNQPNNLNPFVVLNKAMSDMTVPLSK
ncbi:MAG: hypothetical protein CMF42_03945 [Legionellales bacterium]|nr:hypothetical protein [Legionellales bacterium]OUX67495.1 MAG: hypothetical protein CBD38_02325 [bacterium TMED178]